MTEKPERQNGAEIKWLGPTLSFISKRSYLAERSSEVRGVHVSVSDRAVKLVVIDPIVHIRLVTRLRCLSHSERDLLSDHAPCACSTDSKKQAETDASKLSIFEKKSRQLENDHGG